MKTLTIKLALPGSVELSQEEARELLVLRLVDEARLSQSQAAQMLGLTRYNLIELMARHKVPVVRYTGSDWERESRVLGSAGQLRRQRRAR